jgi:DegV family protein with EDD domain
MGDIEIGSGASAIPQELDGLPSETLATALRSGIHRVIREQDFLNRINVFPVADGDTGTNLSLSLGAALETISTYETKPLGTLLAALADVLLDSARGNSGAIVAQFFQGLSDSAESFDHFSTRTFARAVSLGSDYARDALANPCDGTILSVIAVFASSLREQTEANHGIGFAEMLNQAVAAAQTALAETTGQLEQLRKAGVVDAGASGFVTLIEGITAFIAEGQLTDKPDLAGLLGQAGIFETAGETASVRFRYCTECIVTADDIDRRKLRERLSELGDSLVLAGTKRKAKIHIHVNEPEAVFDLARSYGRVAGEKADDMQHQQQSTHNMRSKFAVITDSAADISDQDLERHDIHMVPCRIQFGDRGYLDKVSISTREFFDELAANPIHPTSSQPSPGDFRRQYQFLASHFPDVISISLTPEVSGTLQAAQSAASRIIAAGTVHIVNSRNASLGQGLLAVFAAECAEAGLDAAETLQALEALIPQTRTYGLIRDLRFAVKGGRVAASRKMLADLLHVTPVLRNELDGTITANGILPGRRRLIDKFARYVAKRSDRERKLRLAIGHAVCEEEALKLQTRLHEELPDVTSSTIADVGSALGVHGGPGTLIVAVQAVLDPENFRKSPRRQDR